MLIFMTCHMGNLTLRFRKSLPQLFTFKWTIYCCRCVLKDLPLYVISEVDCMYCSYVWGQASFRLQKKHDLYLLK